MPNIIPTPYEYALISQEIYHDGSHDDRDRSAESSYGKLVEKGWRCATFIAGKHLTEDGAVGADDGYLAGLFVNDERKQLVIAHRGSQNADSWITDAETVAKLKPGSFVYDAIQTLAHPEVLRLKEEESYRLSTTGHSLGGFLAQVCVYWARRSDFEGSGTYHPSLDAVVFDSPGVVDFLEVLQPKLISQQGRINLRQLPIHNFCAMPTVVSTFGTQTGTLWDLDCGYGERLAFVNAHLMSVILRGFDPETGFPETYKQIRNWPQADYSEISSLFSLMQSSRTELVVKLSFACMNSLYKGLRQITGYEYTPTWYDRLFGKAKTRSYIHAGLETLSKELVTVIMDKYRALPEGVSQHRIGLEHFSVEHRKILVDLNTAKSLGEHLGWRDKLIEQFGESNIALLTDFILEVEDDKIDVVLTESESNVFDFSSRISALFDAADYKPHASFLTSKIDEMQKELEALAENAQQRDGEAVTANLRTAVASVERALALKMTGPEDYKPERIAEVAKLHKQLRDNGATRIVINQGGAVTDKPGGVAVVMPSTKVDPSAAQLAQSLLQGWQNKPVPGGAEPQRQQPVALKEEESIPGKSPGSLPS